jgi:hypothetical protein
MTDDDRLVLERIATALETIAGAVTPPPETIPDDNLWGLVRQLRDWRWKDADPSGWADELEERHDFNNPQPVDLDRIAKLFKDLQP